MKPLIFILLTTISLEAQSLADIARKERERQAKATSSRVITMDRSGGAQVAAEAPKPEAPETPATPPAVPPATAAPSTPAASPAKQASPTPTPSAPVASVPTSDAAKKYADDLARMRIRVQQLQDQDAALQIQINEIKNQVFAPVTDAQAQAVAQNNLGDAQQKLDAVRLDLTASRAILRELEAQGPPK